MPMRRQDMFWFQEAAKPGVLHPAGLWILVRDTNAFSLEYIGRVGHAPKPPDVKAKTASVNFGGYLHAGLVVSPKRCENSFKPEKRQAALEEWEKFVEKHPLQPWRYEADGQSMPLDRQPEVCVNEDVQDRQHYGCLLYKHHYLYGDYDLDDIVLADAPTRNLALVGSDPSNPAGTGRYTQALKVYMRQKIGVDMVQHGAQAQGFGHMEHDGIHVFGPTGNEYEFFEGDPAALEARLFSGRKALDVRKPSEHPRPQGPFKPRIVK